MDIIKPFLVTYFSGNQFGSDNEVHCYVSGNYVKGKYNPCVNDLPL